MLVAPLATLLLGCSPSPGTDGAPDDRGADTSDDASDDTSGDTSDDTSDDTSSVPNRWNVLVYMDGDNNLESFVTHDLNELEAAGSGSGVTILVQADRIDGYDTSDGDWTGTRRYLVTRDEDNEVVSSTLLEELGELDMGDPATLADFLTWAHTEYPAEHTLLSMWDHGDGWYATDAPPPPPSIASDDTSGTVLSIAEGDLTAGLQAHVDLAGPIDVLAFDACYMATWEVADSLRGQVETMVASEGWVGSDGLLYAPLVRRLQEDPELTGAELGATMAADSVAEGNELTFSAVDVTAVGTLTERIDALARWGLSSPDTVAALLRARGASRGADEVWSDFYHDVGDLADALVAAEDSPEDVVATALATREAVDAAVLAAHGNADYDWTSGLTILFGTYSAETLDHYHTAPGATWSQATQWDEYLLAARAHEQASSAR